MKLPPSPDQPPFEEQRWRHEQLLRVLADDAPEIVVLFNRNLQHTYVNKKIVKLSGQTREYLLGKTQRENGVLPLEVIENWENKIRQVFETAEEITFESKLPDDKGDIYFSTRMTPLFGQGGSVERVAAISHFITKFKRTEEALITARLFNQRITEASPELVYVINLPQLEISYTNKSIEAFLSRNPEELEQYRDTKLEEIILPHQKHEIEDFIQKFGTAREKEVFEREFLYNALDGETRWFIGRELVFNRTATGEVSQILGSAREITQRKVTQLALAKERERLSVTLLSIADGVISTDEAGHIVLINQAATELTGWSEEEALGKPLSAVLQLPNLQVKKTWLNKKENLEQFMELGDSQTLIAKDGTIRLITGSAAFIHDVISGAIIGAVWAIRDITHRQRLEQELIKTQKLESLGRLAGGLAHDFNNMLMAVMGNLEIARLEINDHKKLESLFDEAETALDKVRKLAEQLLTFSPGGEPKKALVYLNSILDETARQILQDSRFRINLKLDADLWPLEIDTGQVVQAIQNILMNSVQAMEFGGTITITTENISQENRNRALPLTRRDYIKITLSDEGEGISAENLPRIFDPYYTTRTDATGLGLSACYSIIARHDGYLMAESEPGKGATFTIYLPATVIPVVAPNPVKSGAIRPTAKPCGDRILVMDDEEMLQKVLKSILTRYGYEVDVTGDGSVAVEQYLAALETPTPYRALIMDLTVPGGMGGKEAIEVIRKYDPKVKAIVASGYSNDPVLAHYQDYGFAGALAKPFGPEELKLKLQEILTEKFK